MIKYWESKFKDEGAMWKFEPSNSATFALNLFKSNHIENILIPGCGYGRNAKLFIDNGIKVTGIEISKTAIDLARKNGIDFRIHNGSVTSMPFDNDLYDGIYCYALIHLLNKIERKAFLKSCYNQLKPGGLMVFVVTSKQLNLYGSGKFLSKDRFEISKGLKVYFYDDQSITNEFGEHGLVQCSDIDEPIKFIAGYDPMKLKLVICKKR
jgi:SAM-dependent methyltransferase